MKSGVVLITGCSKGIGRAAAYLLAQSGFTVIATARRPQTLKSLGAAMTLKLDVADEKSIKAAAGAVMEKYGRIDALVNNAGYGIRGAMEELDAGSVKEMFDVNVNGIIRMAKYVVPIMRKAGSGRIINIGSITGRLTTPVNGAYSASKYAVEALSDAMRLELSPFGIDTVLIEPGNIRTDFKKTAELNSAGLFKRKGSPYAGLYDGFKKATDALRSHEPGPEAAARVILKALTAKKPRARYMAAVPAAVRTLIILPAGLRDFIMKRFYNIAPPRRRIKSS